MSVRVNLLPPSVKKRATARRANVLLVLVVLAFVGLLAFLYTTKQASVDRAVEGRDAAQAQVNELQAQVQALQAFQAIADELDAGNTLLMTAMEGEIAVARVLNDVALSLPSTSSLTSLTLSRQDVDPVAGEVDLGDTVADLLLAGYSIERYAPGVEGVLLQFDQVTGLELTYLNTAARAAIGDVPITSFDATGLLDERIFTGRYDEGLPEIGS